MYAVTIPSYGDPEVLTWETVPDPVPGPGEVLLNVVASAVNRADLLQRQGSYPPPEGAPPYPGLECSGRIAALGAGVTGWQIGDEVCALLSGGGYAEKDGVGTAAGVIQTGSQIMVVFAHGAAGNKDRLVAIAKDVSQKV